MKATNNKELRAELMEVFNDYKAGKVESRYLNDLTNLAGKITNTVKVKIMENQLLKSTKPIEFLKE